MKEKNPTIYSPRAWKFNTGDLARGVGGLIDVPAGASKVLTAEEASHAYARLHSSETPIEGHAAAAGASADLAALEAERDDLVKASRALTEERDALAAALGQTADERVKALEGRLAAAQAETQAVRAQLSKAQGQGGKGK